MEITLNLTTFAEVNEELFSTDYELTIDEFIQLAIVYYTKEDTIVPDIHLMVDYEKLETLGFIKITSDNDPPDFVLRDKAVTLFAASTDKVVELARTYRALFPIGIRTGGYLVRSDEPTVANKMRKFVKTFKQYSPEQIIEATQRYIDRKRGEGWKFMKTASYFLFKDGESALAAECENLRVKEQGEEDDWTRNIK